METPRYTSEIDFEIMRTTPPRVRWWNSEDKNGILQGHQRLMPLFEALEELPKGGCIAIPVDQFSDTYEATKLRASVHNKIRRRFRRSPPIVYFTIMDGKRFMIITRKEPE